MVFQVGKAAAPTGPTFKSATFTGTWPFTATNAIGDLLVVVVSVAGAGNVSAAAPTGWRRAQSAVTPVGNTGGISVGVRIASAANESVPALFTVGTRGGVVLVYSGAKGPLWSDFSGTATAPADTDTGSSSQFASGGAITIHPLAVTVTSPGAGLFLECWADVFSDVWGAFTNNLGSVNRITTAATAALAGFQVWEVAVTNGQAITVAGSDLLGPGIANHCAAAGFFIM